MSSRRNNAVPFRKRPPSRRKARGVRPIMVMLPLTAFTAVFLFGLPGAAWMRPPAASLLDPPAMSFQPLAAAQSFANDRETARFTLCGGGPRIDCVVDGDTFWYRGEKVRIADINAPEVSEPQCAQEAALGHRATTRLLALLNQGAFSLAANDDGTGRDRDRYGRLLRTVTRGGDSLGEALVDEGLAEEWKGYRGSWC